MKNIDILNIFEPLNKIVKQDLPAIKAYKLKKITNKLQSEYKVLTDIKEKLIKKYGQEKDGQIYIASDDKEAIEKYNEEFTEVLNEEQDIDIDKVELTEKDLENIKLSVKDMDMLELIVEFNL